MKAEDLHVTCEKGEPYCSGDVALHVFRLMGLGE